MPVLMFFFAIWNLVGFDHCPEVPSSGRRESENSSLPGHYSSAAAYVLSRKLLLQAAWLLIVSFNTVFCIAFSDQVVLISGYIMSLYDFPILAHISRKKQHLQVRPSKLHY